MPNINSKMKKINVILLLILILGSFLRIYDLGTESFWIDEAITASASQKEPSFIINNIYTRAALFSEFKMGSGEMPLHYVLASYWTKIFGLSEFKFRLFSALFGVLSIYMIFVVGKMMFNPKVGLISAFILAINHQHIAYSQEARSYAFIIFFTLLSIYFLIKSLKQNNWASWLLYSLCSIILIYTHYLTFFILMFQYLYIIIYWKPYKKYLKNAFISAFGIFLAYVPWLAVLFKQLMNSGYNYSAVYKPTLSNFAYIMIQMNSWISPDSQTRVALRNMNFSAVSSNGWLIISSVLGIALLLGMLFILGLFKKNSPSNKKIGRNKVFLALWFAIPIFVPLILSIIFPSASITGIVRYILFATPAYYILAARGASELGKFTRISLILIILLSIIPLYSYYTNFDKEQWREASVYIKNNGQNTELVIINHESSIFPLNYYFQTAGYPNENVKGVSSVEQVKTLVIGKGSLWLIYASEKFGDSKHEIKNYLDSIYIVDSEHEFTGIKIYHYKK